MAHSLLPTRERPVARDCRGFSLVELMVALLILAIGLLSVGRMFVFSQHHAYHGRTETMAVSLAEEIREKILSENWSDVPTVFDGVDTTQPSTITTPCSEWAAHVGTGLGPSGAGHIEVYDPLQDPEIVDGMLTVEITVEWEESGATRQISVRFSTSRMGV